MGVTKFRTINGLQVYAEDRTYYTNHVVFWDDYRDDRLKKGISFSWDSFLKWCRRNHVMPRGGSAPVSEPEYDDIVEEEFSRVLFIT